MQQNLAAQLGRLAINATARTCAAVLLLFAIAISPAQTAQETVKRTLVFPKDYSIGALFLVRDDERTAGFQTHRGFCKQLAIAQGPVSVTLHPHEEIYLELNAKFFQDPDTIKLLAPDSIDVLRIQFKAMEDSETTILNRALVSLAHLTKLKELDIGKSDVDDVGLWRLTKDMTELQRINAESSFISGSTLAKLTKTKNIRELYFQGDHLNPDSLKALINFPKLESLNLSATRIDDAGLRNLSGRSQIKYLRLNKNRTLTNKCVPTLLTLSRLHMLELDGTSITALGLEQLHKLPLERLTFTLKMCNEAQLNKLRSLFGKAFALGGVSTRGDSANFNKTLFEPITRN